MQSKKSPVWRQDDGRGAKSSKERVTVLVTSNATGTDKRELLVIGKSRRPRCFKGQQTLSVDYRANKAAWMTSDIFSDWVKTWDRQLEREGKRIALVRDNAPCHPHSLRPKNIRLVWLSPTTTAVTQPMDQGVIQNLKCKYRVIFCENGLLKALEEHTDIHWDLYKAIQGLYTAWNSVIPQTIRRFFEHCGISTTNGQEDLENSEETMPIAELGDRLKSQGMNVSEEEINIFLSLEENLQITPEITSEEIISQVRPDGDGDSDNDEEEESIAPEIEPITTRQWLEHVEGWKRFVGQLPNSKDLLAAVSSLELKTVKAFKNSKTHQVTIESFLVK